MKQTQMQSIDEINAKLAWKCRCREFRTNLKSWWLQED